jgi:glycosyltransferase involved in cell wall biosynthesis
MFSIVIITHKNIIQLKRCLDSLRAGYLNKQFPIHIMINGKDETTEDFLNQYKEKNEIASLEFHSIEETENIAEARNQAIQFVDTTYVAFICDNIEVPEHYLSKALEVIQRESPDVFGGPDLTHPDSSYFESAVGAVITSKLAKGPLHIKHATKNKIKTNTIFSKEYGLNFCHLWFKTDIFSRQKFHFDSRLSKNEDRVLLHSLIQARRKVLHVEDFYVFNKRSSSITELISYTFTSARYLMYSFFLYPKTFDIAFLAPSIFFIYLLLVPFIAQTNFISLLYVYLFLNLVFSFKVCYQSRKMSQTPLAFFLHLILNVTYGLGALTVIFKKPKKVNLQSSE